jgi:hypothetical protein
MRSNNRAGYHESGTPLFLFFTSYGVKSCLDSSMTGTEAHPTKMTGRDAHPTKMTGREAHPTEKFPTRVGVNQFESSRTVLYPDRTVCRHGRRRYPCAVRSMDVQEPQGTRKIRICIPVHDDWEAVAELIRRIDKTAHGRAQDGYQALLFELPEDTSPAYAQSF